ncbi:MAG: hypothetical protein ACLR8P_10555 [Clostridium fessum]
MIAGGYANYYIGTVEAQPDLQAAIEKLGAQKHYQRAVLQPLAGGCRRPCESGYGRRRGGFCKSRLNAPDTRRNAASGDWERLRRSEAVCGARREAEWENEENRMDNGKEKVTVHG